MKYQGCLSWATLFLCKKKLRKMKGFATSLDKYPTNGFQRGH